MQRIGTAPGTLYHDVTWGEEERKIPLLIQVFSRFPEVPINIDIKAHNHELIHKVADLIHAFNRVDITVWGSAEKATTDLCYEIVSSHTHILYVNTLQMDDVYISAQNILCSHAHLHTHAHITLPKHTESNSKSRHPLCCYNLIFPSSQLSIPGSRHPSVLLYIQSYFHTLPSPGRLATFYEN